MLHYSSALTNTYMASVVHPSFVHSKFAARAVWRFITCNFMPEHDSQCPEATAVAHIAMSYGIQDMVYDLRMFNGQDKNDAFEPFWAELKLQLNDYIAVLSRRHGIAPRPPC